MVILFDEAKNPPVASRQVRPVMSGENRTEIVATGEPGAGGYFDGGNRNEACPFGSPARFATDHPEYERRK